MDGYHLTAALAESVFKFLGSLAWPAAFFGAAWLFREKLVSLLPFLRMKYKDLDVSFRLEQAEKEAAQIPPPADPVLAPTPEEKSRFELVAEHSPRAAILEKRAELDQVIRAAAEPYLTQTSPKNWKTVPTTTAIRALRSQSVIDDRTSALLDDLRVIGNRAAHGADGDAITKEEALRFGKLADSTMQFIQMLS